MNKYTYADIIIDPEDERVEIGEKYYCSEFPAICIEDANSSRYMPMVLESVDKEAKTGPFRLGYGFYHCIIRAKEPEKKLVPFDFNDPKDRDFLRGKWVKLIEFEEEDGPWDGLAREFNEQMVIGFANIYDGHNDDYHDLETYGAVVYLNYDSGDAEWFLDNCQFLDGRPCGKEVEG